MPQSQSKSKSKSFTCQLLLKMKLAYTILLLIWWCVFYMHVCNNFVYDLEMCNFVHTYMIGTPITALPSIKNIVNDGICLIFLLIFLIISACFSWLILQPVSMILASYLGLIFLSLLQKPLLSFFIAGLHATLMETALWRWPVGWWFRRVWCSPILQLSKW